MSRWESHFEGTRSVAFSPDGRHIVSGSDDTTIRIWDMEMGTQVGEPFRGHTYFVSCVAFSSDPERRVGRLYNSDLGCGDRETGGRCVSRTHELVCSQLHSHLTEGA